MIAVSCFSAAAACTLAGSRVYLAMAQDGVFFRSMAPSIPSGARRFSLIGQGSGGGAHHERRYDQLYTYVIFGMVLSYTLTVIGLFILRWKRPDVPRRTAARVIPGCREFMSCRSGVDAQHDYSAADGGILGAAIVLIGVPDICIGSERAGRKLR